jgi:integrase
MRQWREDARVAYRRTPKGPAPDPPAGFAADAERYLAAVRAMPSYADRARDIAVWVAVLEDRPRASVTATEIATQLAAWARELAASTVNHRRTALMHLWRVLDGRGAANPVRETPKYREPEPEARGLSYDVVCAILDAMPDSASRARLAVMAWTGIPHAQLARITPADVDLERRMVSVRARRKGAGARGRAHPLSDEGVAAFRLLARWDAFGPFSRSSLHKSFRLACGKVELERGISLAGVRPYDLRHSYGTAVYAATGDIRITQHLLGHARADMTQRYTLGAVDALAVQAVARFGEASAAAAKGHQQKSPVAETLKETTE